MGSLVVAMCVVQDFVFAAKRRHQLFLFLHQFARLDAQCVGQFAYRAGLCPLLAGFKAAYRVEGYPRYAPQIPLR
jgi:hypothetical protein